jgi:sensor histidine kinase YesM
MKALWKKLTFGIQRKILFSVFFFILVMFVIQAALLNLFIGNILTERSRQGLAAIGDQVSRSLDQSINEWKQLAAGVSLDPLALKIIKVEYGSDYERVVALNQVYRMLESNRDLREFIQIYLFSLNGNYMISSDPDSQFVSGGRYERLKQLPLFRAMENEPYDVMVLPFGLKPDTFSVAFRIDGESGAEAGYVIVAVSKKYFDELLRASDPPGNIEISIETSDGQTVFMDAGSMNGGVNDADKVRNERFSEATGWKIKLAKSTEEERSDLVRIRWLLFSVMAVLSSMMYVVLILIIRRITRSLRQLTKSMMMVENNNFNVHFNISSNDEVGRVGQVFNQMVSETNRLINELIHTKVLATEAKLSALQQQINPHYLYNSLGLINSLAAIHRIAPIQQISQNLADLFRYNMDGQGRMFVRVREELDSLEKYMQIQQKILGDRFTYRIDIQSGLGDAIMLKFLLQPIVENCFEHGFQAKAGPCRIDIVIRQEQYRGVFVLRIDVTDNGKGIEGRRVDELVRSWKLTQDLHSALPKAHIGLHNVHWRIALTYGEPYGLSLASELGAGTTVTLRMPMKEAEPT